MWETLERFLWCLLLRSAWSPYAQALAWGQVASPPGEEKVGADKPRAQAAFNARAVIASLENHNPPPLIIGVGPEYAARFDIRYNWSEYNRVLALIQVLADHAEEAWPELVGHLDDERYCTTLKYSEDFTRSHSVGDICREIICGWLSGAYYRHIRDAEGDISGTAMMTMTP